MDGYTVEQLSDKSVIRSFLMRDSSYAAYALGDLEPPHAEHATWLGALRGGGIEGLALVYSAFEPPVLFLMGSRAALGALLATGALPRRALVLAPPRDEPTIRRSYRVERMAHMLRMRVTAQTFRPAPNEAERPRAQRLKSSHFPAMRALLQEAAAHDARDLDDIAIETGMVADGIYYGVCQNSILVAMAGTHLIAPVAGLAAVGNVVVHPSWRGKGLGKLVSSEVTQALLATGIEQVVLNVQRDNTPAIRLYERLGYTTVSRFIEGVVERP